jgi:tetratricopeptide (TPR) repeat protein
LYPFVRRFDAVTVDEYHRAVDDGFKVTVATPQLVPPECWNYLCYDLEDGISYRPNPNPHVNEWHKHNPPPGTAYDIHPRLNHPSLISRSDAVAQMDTLHERAPYDSEIADYIYEHKYQKHPTYEQANALFSEVLAYRPGAIARVARTVSDQPERYEMLLNQAAELNPVEYFTLADFFIGLKQDDKAAAYLEKGGRLDPDSLMIASKSTWLVRYYLKHGRMEDARKTADFAGEVYSYNGLVAKATFLEETGDYAGAYEWYANIMDRYEEYGPLLSFCLRYKNKPVIRDLTSGWKDCPPRYFRQESKRSA